MPGPRLRVSDLQGLAHMATQATSGIARIAEGVTQSVWGTLGLPGGAHEGQTRGMTGQVFRAIEGVTRLTGKSLQAVLGTLVPLLQRLEAEPKQSYPREAVLAALNGVLGDRLHAQGNTLATRMALYRVDGQSSVELDLRDPQSLVAAPLQTGGTRLLVLVHGLCMNELQWTPPGASGHASALADAGYTPLYVRYNTGRPVSHNGRDLSALLEQLLDAWPHPVQDLTLLTHSMGGLVARSAVQQAKPHWRAVLKNMVFLGTPHQGAPLERAGHWIDTLLGSTPYSKPFATLATLRSAGITDLRYGHVQEGEVRHPLPLPEGVACYAIGATLAAKRSPLAERVVGDGLVPLHSALGQHSDAAQALHFAKGSTHVVYRSNHMQLLYSEAVTAQLLQWLVAQRT